MGYIRFAEDLTLKRRVKTLHAINPNEGVRSWYQRELDALLSEAQTELVAMVQTPASVALAQDWSPDSIDDEGFYVDTRFVKYHAPHLVHLAYDSNGQATESRVEPEYWTLTADASSPNTRLNAALKKWGDKWSKKFDKAADRIAKQFAAKSFQAFQSAFKAELKNANFTVRFSPTRQSLAAFSATVSENVALIKSIQQQYHTKVQGDVWRAVTRGSDLSKLSTDLRSTYGVTVKRAALIARDQNAKAKATIENTRRQELGITQAIWQHSSAGKEPRPTHVAMNGKVFDLKQGMYDSDEGEWILPGQLINCRCTSRAIIKGFGE